MTCSASYLMLPLAVIVDDRKASDHTASCTSPQTKGIQRDSFGTKASQDQNGIS